VVSIFGGSAEGIEAGSRSSAEGAGAGGRVPKMGCARVGPSKGGKGGQGFEEVDSSRSRARHAILDIKYVAATITGMNELGNKIE